MAYPSGNDKNPVVDAYAVLEFQGVIADIPTYDREKRELRFVAKASGKPLLPFVTRDEIAAAYKALLSKGVTVQLRAMPESHMVEIAGKRYWVIQWRALRIVILGDRRIDLGRFGDIRILDGLIPGEYAVPDVGYIDPKAYKKTQELKKRAKEVSESDDKNL